MELDFSKTVPSDMTADYILSRVSQEEIILHFTGNPVVYNRHILSPLRQERTPSFTYKITTDGKIIWADWSTGEKGDCFALVMQKYGLTYGETLNTIYKVDL